MDEVASKPKSPKKRVRGLIRSVHLYGGLLCAAYLLIFGFTTLNFNHHFRFAEPTVRTMTWQSAALSIEIGPDQAANAARIGHSLGLVGWIPPWKISGDYSTGLQFEVDSPGKDYILRAGGIDRIVRVEERRKGFWPVISGMHGMMSLPNSRFVSWWGWYTEFCALVVFLSALSGVYLWIEAGRDRRLGTIVLVLALVSSLAFMLWIIGTGL